MSGRGPLLTRIATGLLALGLATPGQVFACATCFGKSDSALAKGMNMGIFSLLVVITGVLGMVASFFVFLGRRSSRVSGNAPAAVVQETMTPLAHD